MSPNVILNPEIIHEDESFFVVNKPSGWITDSSNTTSNQPVIQKWIADNYSFEANDFEHRNGIVHRLDKETSGILLVAKTNDSFGELQRQFKERLVHKKYTALVHGNVTPDEGVINETVGRLPWRRDRFGVLPEGREAITGYKKLKNYSFENNDYSLLELKPETGRTHQIRIHLKHLGNPIVGDEFYAGRKTAKKDRKWCPRLFLHSGEIEFIHPVSKEKVKFSSPLPQDLTDILDRI
ncbi:MAG: RluA family pseudouridine synthase [Microgenomates group bacterium]